MRIGEEIKLYFPKTSETDLDALNCRLKAQECERATLFLTWITWIEVDPKLSGNDPPGCK